jgi:hypothetical protein
LEADEYLGYSTLIKQKFENIKFEPDSMSEYPYMFSDINVDMIVEKKEIVVKCVGGKEYKLKFG